MQSTTLENALKILHPAQKKLSSVEAQRVMAVVDEALSKLERALSLTYLSESMDRFSVSLGSEVVSLVSDYTKLVSDYMRWYEEQADCDEFLTAQAQLRHSCKSLLRALGNVSSTTEGVLREAESDRRAQVSTLLDSMRQLRGVMHEKLLTTKLEDVNRRQHLSVVVEQQKMAEAKIAQLEAEVTDTQNQKNIEVSELPAAPVWWYITNTVID